MKSAAATLLMLTLAAASSGCQAPFQTPPEPEALLLIKATSASARPHRRVSEVDLRSTFLSGIFQETLIASGGGTPSVRLQWHALPAGKMLDLVVTGEGFSGSLASGTMEMNAQWGEPLPRHFLSFLVLSLLESRAPLTPDRVLASRRTLSGWHLLLTPVTDGLWLWVEISHDGELLARNYRYRGVRWTETFGPHRFTARDLTLTLTEVRQENLLVEPDPSLFQRVTPGAESP